MLTTDYEKVFPPPEKRGKVFEYRAEGSFIANVV